ncbi:thrombospondin type 3 repeat-containing protein [Spongiimicrobium salis]|uniref:thrombospondin type 3 repeat-containing protein n=1 Tax=Spongiimicrobium salis TaxID=1667022 RepID=UPI00374D6B6B
MIRKLLFVCLFIGMYSHAQYHKSTPWMAELEKKKSPTLKNGQEQYSLFEISEAFNNYWKDRDHTAKGSGYKPFKRWENYWKHMVDADGFFPSPQEIWGSYQKKNNLFAETNPVSSWESIGPFTPDAFDGLIAPFPQRPLPGHGRVNAIAVDPNNPNTWYAGAPAGGIWRSIDGGNTWTSLFDEFLQIGVSGIAIDPNDSNIIYIATGDDDAFDSYSIGVYKSLNGGQTWNETGLNPTNVPIGGSMNEITIDPTNSDIVWVGTSQGLFKTINGGDTWDNVNPEEARDFKLKPGDPNTVYVVSNTSYSKSTDGGATFTRITDILPGASGRLAIGVTPANPEVVYIVSADIPANDFAFQGLYRSTDSGETFTQTLNTVDIFERNQAWYDLAIEVSPTDEDDLFIGAINIWRSTDGGDIFVRLNSNDDTLAANYTHVDIHTLKFFNGSLFCGSDGGLFVSGDSGDSFTNRTFGMAITQFYRISVANGNSSQIVGGTQDNSGLVYSNGVWNNFTIADGMDYEIDPNNQDLIYGFIQNGNVLFISSNTGETVSSVFPPINAAGDARISGNWITPLAIGSDSEVYAGYDAVYRLVGNAWEQVSQSFSSSNIDDLEVAPSNPQVLYVAEGNSVFRSTNGGITFVLLGNFDADVSSIAPHSSDDRIVYVTLSNLRGNGIPQIVQPNKGVFRLTVTDSGTVRDDLTFNLPDDQALFSIAHQGRDTNNPIYVGTSLGVYRLDDTLTEWEEYFTNLPNVGVSDLEISLDEAIITASTFGRGIWQSPIPVQVPENDLRLISLTPNPNTVICGEIIPEIEVNNNGLNTVNEITVTYTINGGADLTFVWNGTLNSNASTTIALPPLALSGFGQVELNVNATIAGDAFDDNNDAITNFIFNDFGTGDDIITFESDDDSLLSFNDRSSDSVWERGEPTGTLLNTAGSGTQVYGTNLDGNHPNNTLGFIYSGCYELSSILAPVLTFNMAYDLEENFDIVYVEYSIDDGTTWNLLGNINSQPNWYTSDRTNASSGAADDCQNCPGGQWTGTNATLTEYAYDFTANAASGETDLTNEGNVLFRIAFQSDPNTVQEGAIVDDFVVTGFQDDDDDDNDGVLDVDDNCPLIGNANQLDTDSDGEGDACDDDDDGDGILDVNDNCPLTPNPNQADADGDGIGDVCDNDADNDGVPNDLDLCPDTPANSVVDVDGCAVFSLPANNFRILTTGESCISSNNGSIAIEAAESLNYTASLTQGGTAVSSNDFTTTTSFEDLTAGNYTVCITVAGQSDFENCFDITIVEPEPLSVTSKVSTLKSEVTLSLSGSAHYTVTINDVVYTTSQNEITLPLPDVENVISVKTDLDCQGVFLETVILNTEAFIYPNPITNGNLTVVLDDNSLESVQLALYTFSGSTVFRKDFKVSNGTVNFNVDNLSRGVYLLNVRTDKELLNYKIVRR